MSIIADKKAIEIVKENQTIAADMIAAREYTDDLKAVIAGKDYVDKIVQIDHLESEKKINSRKKYTFSTKDLAERVFRPIDNVWSATGGNKVYSIDNEKKEKELSKWVKNFRGGKSIEQYLENSWEKLYHVDPAGVIGLDYDADLDIKPFPVYYSIHEIRKYSPNGINVNYILFEPYEEKTDNGTVKIWRLVDDLQDRKIIQEGDNYRIDEESTFNHPFGQVPVLINSDIEDVDDLKRLSPADGILELLKEYLRDKSIKTIFKFLQGIPLFWRYVTHCEDCTGTGRDGQGEICSTCNGHGIIGRRDVTDSLDIEIPSNDENVLAPNIAGWIVPPIDIWDKYDLNLLDLEKLVKFTHWGSVIDTEVHQDTATGKVIDAQAIIQRLYKYTQQAEIREHKLTEWGANYLDILKDKNEPISTIIYGRNYALIPAKNILELYEIARDRGDNSIILDNLFQEYLLSKFKSDPISLNLAKIKAQLEPYLHYTIDQVALNFGNQEAQKKMLFSEWWGQALTLDKTVEVLKKEFDLWFTNQNVEQININNNELQTGA